MDGSTEAEGFVAVSSGLSFVCHVSACHTIRTSTGVISIQRRLIFISSSVPGCIAAGQLVELTVPVDVLTVNAAVTVLAAATLLCCSRMTGDELGGHDNRLITPSKFYGYRSLIGWVPPPEMNPRSHVCPFLFPTRCHRVRSRHGILNFTTPVSNGRLLSMPRLLLLMRPNT